LDFGVDSGVQRVVVQHVPCHLVNKGKWTNDSERTLNDSDCDRSQSHHKDKEGDDRCKEDHRWQRCETKVPEDTPVMELTLLKVASVLVQENKLSHNSRVAER